LRLVGILFPHIKDDARSKPHKLHFNFNFVIVSPLNMLCYETVLVTC